VRIALDYDSTYTADPSLWDGFIALAKERGHSVWIVTCRRDTDENRQDVKVSGCFIVFTGSVAKSFHCKERGLKIDIWIDDDPACILNGK
jgi:hypothetical protein